MLIFNNFFQISVILLYITFAPSSDLSLNIAERFFNLGDYYIAITEYERFIFFNSDTNNENISYAYYKIGLAYRNQQKWNECIDAFQKSIQTALAESTRDERKIDLAVALISSGDYNGAEFLLIKLEMFSQVQEIKLKAAFFRAISSLYSFKWKQAKEAFSFCFPYIQSESQKKLKQVYSLIANAEHVKYRSPQLAKIFSTILPGSGQIYAGNWANGINALLINIATGYLFINDILNRQYFNAIFNTLFIFERFYSGNRFNAEESAKKHNYQINKSFLDRILKIISSI